VATQDDPDAHLAEAIRELRRERERTQEDVAHDAGLTLGSYGEIERGRANPAWTTVRRIADALEIDVSQLAALVEAREGS